MEIPKINPELLVNLGMCKNPLNYGTEKQLTGTVIDLINYDPKDDDIDMVYTAIAYKLVNDEVMVKFIHFCCESIQKYNPAKDLQCDRMLKCNTAESIISLYKSRNREQLIVSKNQEEIDKRKNRIQSIAVTYYDAFEIFSKINKVSQEEIDNVRKTKLIEIIKEAYKD